MMRFLTLFFIIFSLCFYSQSSNISLENIFSHPSLNSSIIGISVKEASTGKIIYEKNSHSQLVPASIFKLLTTFITIEKLGADFKFKTEIYYSGNIRRDTLFGNLIIKGYGDPTFESRFFSTSALNELVQKIKNKNIRYIKGKLILVTNYFSAQVNGNWAFEDVNNYYAAVPHPLNIFDNEYHLYFETGAKGQYAKVLNIEPQYEFPPKIVITSNNVVAKEGGDNAYIYGDPFSYEKRIEGSVPPFQKKYSIEGCLPDPPRMLAESILNKFSIENIRIAEKNYNIINDTFNLKPFQLLDVVYSPPLSEIFRLTNLHSINLFAESMLYVLGNGDYDNGKKILLETLIKKGIDKNEVNIDDACGLSRLDGISANAMTEFLIKAYSSPYKNILLNGLPVAGESGTMKNFSDTAPLKGNLKCKTGYFARVRTFAGFLNTKTGKTLAVCIMFNNFNASLDKIKQSTKQFFETLYQMN